MEGTVTRAHRATLGLLILAALVLLAAGAKLSPGASLKVPATVTEDWPAFRPPPGRPVLGPDQHIGGYVYTPHRYPPACGNDISIAIREGFQTMALPNDSDALWIAGSPSEAEL